MPYGPLVQWHQRTDVCGSSSATAVNISNTFDITGYPPCPSGSSVQPTPYVTMVWQVPVAGGPLAIQPPDIQIVEAATMQTRSLAGCPKTSASAESPVKPELHFPVATGLAAVPAAAWAQTLFVPVPAASRPQYGLFPLTSP